MGNILVWMRNADISICFSTENESNTERNYLQFYVYKPAGFKIGLYGPWQNGVPLRFGQILRLNSQTTNIQGLIPFIIARFCNHGHRQYIFFPALGFLFAHQ
jgi:hypothetical protein